MLSRELCLKFLNLMNLYLKYRKMKRARARRKRRWRVQPLNEDWYRGGYYRSVFKDLKHTDEEQLFEHTRMTVSVYELFLKLMCSGTRRSRQRIGPEERLSLTLLHLAHALSMKNIARTYKIGKATVRNIVLETCEKIWRLLAPTYVREPTEKQYERIARDFYEKWDIPNCVGALHGRYIDVKMPSKALLIPYEEKNIVLKATCDANYNFTTVCIGGNNNESDGDTLRDPRFVENLMTDSLPLPPSAALPNTTQHFPHYFASDMSFPLRKNLMRPYSDCNNSDWTKKIYNYRLSKAHRVIENAFGILTSRWKVLLTTMECLPENCEKIVLACIALHNFIMKRDEQQCYCPPDYVDTEEPDLSIRRGQWRNEEQTGNSEKRPLVSQARSDSADAMHLRDTLANYFVNEGAIPDQEFIALADDDM